MYLKKKIVFPGRNIPWGSQISVSFVSPGREPWEIAKIRETHGKFVRVDGFVLPCFRAVLEWVGLFSDFSLYISEYATGYTFSPVCDIFLAGMLSVFVATSHAFTRGREPS